MSSRNPPAWLVELHDSFEPEFEKAIILAAAAKQGVNEKQFYKKLIAVADRRFDAHLRRQAKRRGRG